MGQTLGVSLVVGGVVLEAGFPFGEELFHVR